MAIAGLMNPKKADNDVISVGGSKYFSTFYGYYMLEAMAMAGNYQGAMDRISEYWGAMLDLGATTFWEQWNAITPDGEIRDPSMNHYAYGAIGNFLYRRILGMEAIAGGYRKFRVKPLLGGGITWAKGHTHTAYGKTEVGWYVEKEQFHIHVTVPVSTECELVMPSGKVYRITSGQYHYSEKLGKECSI